MVRHLQRMSDIISGTDAATSWKYVLIVWGVVPPPIFCFGTSCLRVFIIIPSCLLIQTWCLLRYPSEVFGSVQNQLLLAKQIDYKCTKIYF